MFFFFFFSYFRVASLRSRLVRDDGTWRKWVKNNRDIGIYRGIFNWKRTKYTWKKKKEEEESLNRFNYLSDMIMVSPLRQVHSFPISGNTIFRKPRPPPPHSSLISNTINWNIKIKHRLLKINYIGRVYLNDIYIVYLRNSWNDFINLNEKGKIKIKRKTIK